MSRGSFAKSVSVLCVSVMVATFADSRGGEKAQGDSPNTNGPISWQVLGPGGGGGIFKPTISPHDPALMLAHCDMTGAYASENGYRFKWGQRPNLNPREPGAVYLSTYGGSVFYGPAKGVPDAVADIVNMPPTWW